MNWLWDLNLIHCFDYYLLLVFLASTALRIRKYRIFLGLIWLFPGRWPLVLQLVKQHRGIFFAWGTLVPALLALVLSVGQLLLSRFVWPQAHLTVAQLRESLPAVLVAGSLGVAMVGLDCVSALRVGTLDRAQVEKQLDQGEYWLKSWTGPVLRFLTLGFVNPRKLVGVEFRKALVVASRQFNASLWWLSLQVSLRIAFGLTLWLTYFRSYD